MVINLLENDRSDLLPNVPGWNFRNFRLFWGWDAGHKVSLVPRADLRPLNKLVTKVQSEEDGDVDV
jgi:hypothetical protein